MGDRLNYLIEATQLLNDDLGITVEKISSVYETAPWGLKEQDDFYNIVLEIRTSLLPVALLEVCQEVEHQLGRKREIPWGPRTIDIDILLYEDVQMQETFLTIPHQHLLERSFVTKPLIEIAPHVSIEGVNISAAVKKYCDSEEKVFKLPFSISVIENECGRKNVEKQQVLVN